MQGDVGAAHGWLQQVITMIDNMEVKSTYEGRQRRVELLRCEQLEQRLRELPTINEQMQGAQESEKQPQDAQQTDAADQEQNGLCACCEEEGVEIDEDQGGLLRCVICEYVPLCRNCAWPLCGQDRNCNV